jgi:hypothetical protein
VPAFRGADRTVLVDPGLPAPYHRISRLPALIEVQFSPRISPMPSRCAALLLMAAAPAFALDTLRMASSDPVLEAHHWTSFDRTSGVAGQVLDLFEDQEGNIWLGTTQGAQPRPSPCTTARPGGHTRPRTA